MIERPVLIVKASSGTPSWMVSLADLLALMLTFFVLLFSMNAVQLSEWQAVVSSFREQFNPEQARIGKDAKPDADRLRNFVPWASNPDYLSALFSDRWTSGDPSGEEVGSLVRQTPDRVILGLPADMAFDLGAASVTPAAKKMLEDLASQLDRLDNQLVVSGHTDPSPVKGRVFASNWELSLRRAESVANLLRESGYQRPIRIFGYGDGQFDMIDPAVPLDQRSEFARRVDIEILAWKTEPNNER
ncbi:OmpA/MotB protein [Iodidimonas gelatinilytica]|uniref:OmpA/MotB protein n=1 Tax=Iodidimonas gelatinilytica TaxID=1236966 RepID=A0A5A7MLC4_9PROT|nr:flagellar motor protein MotB [Iodidimonas gelatinilytica]GEQ96750.1 OmpA/MotB protein [Iodidimonas gelatinilytica]